MVLLASLRCTVIGVWIDVLLEVFTDLGSLIGSLTSAVFQTQRSCYYQTLEI